MRRNSGVPYDLWRARYAGGQWIAVGGFGTIPTSPNGFAWTTNETGTKQFLYDASYGEGSWIVVGSQGVILQSDALTPMPLELQGAGWNSEDQFQLRLLSPGSGEYEVDSSSNLTSWEPLVQLEVKGNVRDFLDPSASGQEDRFYRVFQAR